MATHSPRVGDLREFAARVQVDNLVAQLQVCKPSNVVKDRITSLGMPIMWVHLPWLANGPPHDFQIRGDTKGPGGVRSCPGQKTGGSSRRRSLSRPGGFRPNTTARVADVAVCRG